MAGEIVSEWRAIPFRNRGRLHVGIRRMVCDRGTCLLKDGLDGLLKRIGIEWLT